MLRHSAYVKFLRFYTLLSLIVFYVPVHGMANKVRDENGSSSRDCEEPSKLRTSSPHSSRRVDNIEIPKKVEGPTEITESIPEEVRAESDRESAQIRKQLESHSRRKGQWWKLDFVPSIAELTVLAANSKTYLERVAATVKKVLSLAAAGLIQEDYMIYDMSSSEPSLKRKDPRASLAEKTYVSMTFLPVVGKTIIAAASHPAVPMAAAAVAAKVHDLATAKPSSTPLTTNPKAATASPEMPKEVKPAERVQNASLLPQEFSKFSHSLSMGGDVKVDKSALEKSSSTPLTTNPKAATPSPEVPKEVKPAERVQNASLLPQEFSKFSHSLSVGGDVKVDKSVLANSLQKSSTPVATNPKIGDTTSPKIPETLKPSEPVQNVTRMPQESTVLFRTISTLSGQSDLKKEENAFKKESSTFGATTEATKKLNSIQLPDKEKVSQLLPPEANKVTAPKAEISSTPKNNTQKMLGTNKPVETSTPKQSTVNDVAFIAPTCSLPAPNFGQSAQPSDYSAGMKGNQFTVQVPLGKNINGSVSANPLEMVQLAGVLIVDGAQRITRSGPYSDHAKKEAKKQVIMQPLNAQLDANAKRAVVYHDMRDGVCDTTKSAEVDILLEQMFTLGVRASLQGHNWTDEHKALYEAQQITTDRYQEVYARFGDLLVRRSEEDEDRAISQAHNKALECAKTAPAVSEKRRAEIVAERENMIRLNNLRVAEHKAARAQAAMAIVQPANAYHTERMPDTKKQSEEQKTKQEITTTGSPNSGPKKNDRDPRQDAEDAANLLRAGKEALDELKKKIARMPENEDRLGHIFRNDMGHLPRTPDNYRLIEDLVNDVTNYLGPDGRGNHWWGKILENGEQIWAQAYNGVVRNGGLNKVPHPYNPQTGLSRLL